MKPSQQWGAPLHFRHRWWVWLLVLPLVLGAGSAQKTFPTPEDGIVALVEAVRTNNRSMLHAILGERGSKLFLSGDATADAKNREAFIKSYDEANKVVIEADATATLVIGNEGWRLPIPLVKSNDTWRFDSKRDATWTRP